MTTMNYIGLDVHKKTISYCVKEITLPRLSTNCFGTGREHKLNLR
jgi:hypothetical protein